MLAKQESKEEELTTIDTRAQRIVFGFVLNITNDKNEDEDDGELPIEESDEEEEEQQEEQKDIKKIRNIDEITFLITSYFYDKLLIDTNILYTKWNDLLNIHDDHKVNEEELNDIIDFHDKLIDKGFSRKRLPKYEMLRYYFGTSKDINRALNKWQGSIDTYSYYKLKNITNRETKQCLKALSKSCHFCGYHDVKIGKPSPVFVLDYESWNWNDFDDLNHVIKASFYICCWMTDNIQAINNGITLMINSKGIRFHHIKKAMSLLRAIQKSLALRTNNVFFLNLPSLAKNSMKLFLKIYPKHIQDKIHICSNTDSLFDILNSDQIPQLFGGTMKYSQDPQDQNNKTPADDLKSLSTILSSYVDIKDFKHFQIQDSDYDDSEDDDEEQDDTDEDEEEDSDDCYY